MFQCGNVGSCPPSLLGWQPLKWRLVETLAQLALLTVDRRASGHRIEMRV